jgi:hypothetical protein
VTAEIDGQCDLLQVVVAGTPTLDRVAQEITLPLALKNTSHRKLKPPTWLAIDVDSISVLFPTGIMQKAKRVYVDLPAPDSVGTPGGPVPGACVWGNDTLLAAATGPQVLPGGATGVTLDSRNLGTEGPGAALPVVAEAAARAGPRRPAGSACLRFRQLWFDVHVPPTTRPDHRPCDAADDRAVWYANRQHL